MTKRFMAVLLSLALLLTCVSGLTLAVGAEGELDYANVAKLDFTSGSIVGTNASITFNHPREDATNQEQFDYVKNTFGIEPDENGIVAMGGKSGILMYRHNRGFGIRFGDIGLTGEDVAVTVEYYLPSIIRDNTRLGSYIGDAYQVRAGGNGSITNNLKLVKEQWNIVTYIVSGANASNFIDGFEMNNYCWNDDLDYYLIGSISIMAASKLNPKPAAAVTPYEYFDFVNKNVYVPNPYFPDYLLSEPVTYGLKYISSGEDHSTWTENGLEIDASGYTGNSTNPEEIGGFQYFDTVAGRNKQYLMVKLVYAPGWGGVNSIDTQYNQKNGEDFHWTRTYVNAKNEAVFAINDADFRGACNGGSIRFSHGYGKTLIRAELYICDTQAELDDLYASYVDSIRGYSLKGFGQNDGVKGSGSVVVHDGYYCWKFNSDNANNQQFVVGQWGGYNDILKDAEKVTFEIEMQYDADDPHDARFSLVRNKGKDSAGKSYSEELLFRIMPNHVSGKWYTYSIEYDISKVNGWAKENFEDSTPLYLWAHLENQHTNFYIRSYRAYDSSDRNKSVEINFLPVTQVYGNSLTLEGQIGVNFFMYKNAAIDQNASVKLNDMVYPISTATTGTHNGRDVYKFSYCVAAKEMNEDIVMTVLNDAGDEVEFYDKAGNAITSYSYTVETYLDNVPADETQALKDLAAAMSDYGDLAVKYFSNDNTANDATLQAALDAVTLATLDSYKSVKSEGFNANTGYKGYSLVLESETELRFYFNDVTDHTRFAVNNGATLEFDDDRGYVAIKNIVATDLDKAYTLTVDSTNTITASALSYTYTAINNDLADNLVNLVKGLYLYNQAANAYFV